MSKNWDDEKDLMEYDYPYCPYCRQNPHLFQQLFGPMFGPPGQKGPQQAPPFGPPGQHGPQGGPPSGPPPSKTPKKPDKSKVGLYAVDPGAIRPCRYQYVYLWLEDGRSFWAWLTFVGPRSASGYRWTGYGWRYFGIDLRSIESFECF